MKPVRVLFRNIAILFFFVFSMNINAQQKNIVMDPIPFGEFHLAKNPKIKGSLFLSIAHTDYTYYVLGLDVTGIDRYDSLPLDGAPFVMVFKQYPDAGYYPASFTVKTKKIETGFSGICAIIQGFMDGLIAEFYRKKHYCPIEKIVYFTAEDGIVEFICDDPQDKLEYYLHFKKSYNQFCDKLRIPLADRETF